VTTASVLGTVTLALLVAAAPACASSSVRVNAYSQEAGNEVAHAGGSITVASGTQGSHGSPGGSGGGGEASGAEGGSAGAPAPASQGHVEPLGQGSYRYTGAEGQECYYLTEGINTCAGEEVRPAAPAQPARPAVNPEALAVTVSSRLSLEVGRVAASPSAQTEGLTGAASWFWLEPAPAPRSLSIVLGAEHVTVSASIKEVLWVFGDGGQLSGGAGLPYRPGAAPAGAVTHVYQTRCLPGDQGHDPNVLSSCGPNGYTVTPSVVWAISYQASGPVTASGALPSRTTSTSMAYPVSEARAFLTPSGSGE
jgi:hypothetical protein